MRKSDLELIAMLTSRERLEVRFEIHISADAISNVEVYSMDGRPVYHGNGKSIPMSKGAYVVKVTNGGT